MSLLDVQAGHNSICQLLLPMAPDDFIIAAFLCSAEGHAFWGLGAAAIHAVCCSFYKQAMVYWVLLLLVPHAVAIGVGSCA